MLVGHYGIAFAAKRAAPRTSLGTLTFAAQFADELWPILLLLGIEHVRIVPGFMKANPFEFTYYPFTHSLLAAIVWGTLIGGAYFALKRYRRGAIVIGLIVLSHWFLDLPMHPPDLPVWPGFPLKLGFGAWNSIPLTIILEGIFFLGGLVIYLRTTRARDRIGSWGLWSMVAVLLLIFLSGFFSPPPGNLPTLASFALGLWLFIPWSYWVDRHRALVIDVK